ncbi:MAG: T9SS type A sorting domain-containing protein, partial [Bacteroidetes bacterium]|nr:T9SS type A sorting domain-containing protein [Bacteroidota bacterium]
MLVTNALSYGGVEAGSSTGFIADGFQIGLVGQGHYVVGNEILDIEWEGGPEVYESYAGFWLPGWEFFGSSILNYDVDKTVEIRFDRNVKSKGYFYLRGASPNYAYQGYFESPITIWDVSDKNNPRQLAYAVVEQNGSPMQDNMWTPNGPGDREYLFILDETYSDTPNPTYTGDFTFYPDGAGQMPILWAAWTIQKSTADGSQFPWQDGDIMRWIPNVPFSANDVYTFTTSAPSYSVEAAREDINDIQVFPNPYLGANSQELNKYQRFVTFNHLPASAKFRIFSVDGMLVRSFEKTDDGSQLATWDLQNDNGLPVASGMYIIHIDMPDLGVEKVLKLGVVSEAQYLDRI